MNKDCVGCNRVICCCELRFCNGAGCENLTLNDYCEDHRRCFMCGDFADRNGCKKNECQIKCSSCDEMANTTRTPWGDYAHCTECDQKLIDGLNRYCEREAALREMVQLNEEMGLYEITDNPLIKKHYETELNLDAIVEMEEGCSVTAGSYNSFLDDLETPDWMINHNED